MWQSREQRAAECFPVVADGALAPTRPPSPVAQPCVRWRRGFRQLPAPEALIRHDTQPHARVAAGRPPAEQSADAACCLRSWAGRSIFRRPSTRAKSREEILPRCTPYCALLWTGERMPPAASGCVYFFCGFGCRLAGIRRFASASRRRRARAAEVSETCLNCSLALSVSNLGRTQIYFVHRTVRPRVHGSILRSRHTQMEPHVATRP